MAEYVFVDISQGTLRGRQEQSILGDAYFSFQKIPYAEPPVGPLRFKAPVPAKPWGGVLDCLEEGGISPSGNYFTGQYEANSNENCLFLNVYSKQSPERSRKLPVMVFIHGGGFTCGSGNKSVYGPDFFMSHDIVLVTFNYRLGALGFLSLQTSDCPGNFGLKDQRLALRWVQKNISHFGGDPDNVTLFGESAGAASAHYQYLSKSTRGLFRRVITQSAAAINHWAYSNHPRECAFRLGKRLGCDTDDDEVLLNFLKAIPVKDIVENSNLIRNEVEGELEGESVVSFSFTPTVEPEEEDAFLTKHPKQLLKEGEYPDIPFLTGACSKEMLFALRSLDTYPRWTKDEEFLTLVNHELTNDRATIARKIRQFYFSDGVTLDSYIDVLSANFFNYGIYKTVKQHLSNKERSAPTYLYIFSYDSERALFKNILKFHNYKGVAHADELGYQFPSNMAPFPPLQVGSSDYETIQKFTKLWASFATTGEPTSDSSQLNWPPTDGSSMRYLDIGETLVVKEGFFKEEMDFWDTIYEAGSA